MPWADGMTGGAAVVAAAAALWKWVIAEIVRVRAEIPAADASLNVSVHPLRDGFAAVGLTLKVQNLGSVPLFADLVGTEVVAYSLMDLTPTKAGAAASPEPRTPCITSRPLKDFPFFVLSPGTASEIDSLLIVPTGKTYLLRFTLRAHLEGGGSWALTAALKRVFGHPKSDRERHISWVRSTITEVVSSSL